MISTHPSERAVEVFVGEEGFGTGYRISESLILTCRHVVGGPGECMVRTAVPLDGRPVPATRVWTAESAGVDLALLTVASSSLPPLAPAQLGRFAFSASGRVGFKSWAFPRSHLIDDISDLEEVDGEILLGSHMRTGHLDLHRRGAPLRQPEQNSGASGAAILVDGLLVGVVVVAHDDGRLLGVRLSAVTGPHDPRESAVYDEPLSSRDSFQEWLSGAGIQLPPRTVRPFEDPYRRAIERVAGRCEDFGGRDDERAQVEDFLASDSPYLLWIGKPFSGKTAFAADIAVRPPENTKVVAYFVSRLERSPLDDFRKAVAGQLNLLVHPPESRDRGFQHLDPRGYDLEDLWERAAERVTGEGGRLLLVVDGLDEDEQHGYGGTSIASQLPEICLPGSHVMVTSRYAPVSRGLVGVNHPLQGCPPRQMIANERSKEIWDQVRQGLNSYLHATGLTEGSLHQALLGLSAAAGGHLTVANLKRLTSVGTKSIDTSNFEIRRRMDSVFARLIEPYEELGESGYVFAHDLIRVNVESALGEDINEYRQRIKEWAKGSAHDGWKYDTPAYLLVHYPRMLAGKGDLDALLTLHVPDRYRVLHHRTGANQAAFHELAVTLNLLSNRKEPDLATMLRLALWADLFRNAESNPPPFLTILRARLGDFDKAERLARSTHHPVHRVQALAWVARALVAGEKFERGHRTFDEATSSARAIIAPNRRAMALAEVGCALVEAGDRERGESLLREAVPTEEDMPDAGKRDRELEGIAKRAAESDMPGLALELIRQIKDGAQRVLIWKEAARAAAHAGLLDTAEDIAHAAPLHARASILTALVEFTAMAGGHERIRRLFDAITKIAGKNLKGREDILGDLATAAAEAALLDEADQVMEMLLHRGRKAAAKVNVALVALERNDHERAARALAAAAAVPTDGERPASLELADLARVALHRGVHDDARRLLCEAMSARAETEGLDPSLIPLLGRLQLALETEGTASAARMIANATRNVWSYQGEGRQDDLRSGIARIAARKGLAEEAERVAGAIVDHDKSSEAWSGMALSAAKSGAFIDAERMASAIRVPKVRSSVLMEIAPMAAMTGHLDCAQRLALAIPLASHRNFAVTDVIRSAVDTGHLDAAERLVLGDVFSSPFRRALALAIVAEAANKAGHHDKAERLLALGERVCSSVPNLTRMSIPLPEIAIAAAESGRHKDAEAIAAYITADMKSRVHALTELAARAPVTEQHRARRLVADAEETVAHFQKSDARVGTLVKMARRLTAAEGGGHTVRLLGKALRAANAVRPCRRIGFLMGIADLRAQIGEREPAKAVIEEAKRVALSIESSKNRAVALASIVRRAETICDLPYLNDLLKIAKQVTLSIPNKKYRGIGLTVLASSSLAARTHNGKIGRALLAQAMRIAVEETDEMSRCTILARVARATSLFNNPSYADRILAKVEDVAADVTQQKTKAWLLTVLCRASVECGLLTRAECIAVTAATACGEHSALGVVAVAAAGNGDEEKARQLIEEAVKAARTGTSPQAREKALAGVISHAIGAGLFDQAERLAAWGIRYQGRRAGILGDLAAAAAGHGDQETARRLIGEVIQAVRTGLTPQTREKVLARVTTNAMRAGLFDEAERLATSKLRSQVDREKALAGIAVAAAKAGRFAEAERWATGIADDAERSATMAVLARAAIAAGDEGLARRMLGCSLPHGAGLDVIVRLEPAVARTIVEALDEIQEYVGDDDETAERNPV